MSLVRRHKAMWVVTLACFLILAAPPAEGQKGTEIARMAVHGGSVSWSPLVSAEGLELTVSGRGQVMRSSFRGGESMSFAPVDSEGFQLPDGTYNWEIVVVPRVRDLDPAAFKNGKISADGRQVESASMPERQVLSGVFTIKNGALVDPSLIEAESGAGAGTAEAGSPVEIDDSDAAAPID